MRSSAITLLLTLSTWAVAQEGIRKLMVILTLFPLCAYSQTTLSAYINTPKAGDVIKMQRIVCPRMNNEGTDTIWDLSKSKVLDEEMTLAYQAVDDSTRQLVRIEPYSVSHYQTEGDCLLLSGYEMPHIKVNYQSPIKELQYPFSCGDSIMGTMQGTGRYCEEIPFRIYGHYKQKGEALGTLILPEGDTLSHVLCTCFEQTFITEPLEDFCQLDSIQPLSEDSILEKMRQTDKSYSVTIRKWYTNGYRYPFMEEYNINQSQGQATPTGNPTVYYCPINGQEPIEDSPENRFRRAISEVGATSDIDKNDMSFSYHVSLAGSNQILLTFQLPQSSHLSYKLYTTAGAVLYESGEKNCKGGTYEDTVNIPFSGNRILIIDLHLNDSHITEKIAIE